jgi:hypothetical protein
MSLLESRQATGLETALHEIRAYNNIRGSELADAATKLAVASFDNLPLFQTLGIDMGANAPQPPRSVLYTLKPSAQSPELATSPNTATLRPSLWNIPEVDHLKMHAFTIESLKATPT